MFCFSMFCVTSSLLGAVLLFILVYWRYQRANHYWRIKGVPCEDPLPVIGSMKGYIGGKTLAEVDRDWYKKYGRIFGAYSQDKPMLYVGEPELVKRILIKDFHVFVNRRDFDSPNQLVRSFVSNLTNDEWRRVRSIITPAFSTGKMKKMIPLMLECADTTSRNFMRYAESGQPVDTKRIFGAYTMDVIASTVFGTKLNSHDEPENEFVQNARKLFGKSFSWKFLLFFISPTLTKLLRVNVFEDEVINYFADLASSIVKRRERTNEVRDDFLNGLMEARKNANVDTQNRKGRGEVEHLHKPINKDEDNEAKEDDNHAYFKKFTKNRSISEIELVAQCVIFFLAGNDSTTAALTMVTYYLAMNPKCQDRLLEEVDTVLKKHGTVNSEALAEMKYVDAVISETLRIIPPAGRLERTALEDYPLGDTGITIPKGMLVGIPIYSMQKDPEFFPDPETFNPERFLPENKDQTGPYTFLPFGTGPRNCIGQRLSLQIIKMALVQTYKNFRFHVCPETKIPPKILRGTGLQTPTDTTLKIVKR